MDTTALMTNLITNAEIIFPCYCMDIPYPPQLGNNVLVEELFRGDSYIGMLAWLDAMKQKDKKQSENLLHFLRELWFLHEKKDPFIASQRKILPKLRERKHIDDFVQKLAAIFEADQKTQKPASSLKKDEIDFLIQTTFADHFFISDGAAAFLCYALGRYYDIHGDKDSAADYYRRVLGFRVRFDDYVRSLAVKELRKTGLTNEEYVRYSQADPKVAKNKISHAGADVFCRQLFRDYSDSPSGTILAKQPAEKIISGTDFGKTVKLVPGWYQVTKILFRGHVVADITDKEKVTVVYWRIPKEDDENDYNWGDRGIAHIGKYNTELQKRRDDGLYPVRFSLNDSWLPALASFHNNGNMALVLSLNPNNEPKKMTSDSDSSCVRIEMKKVTDIPEEEPLIVAPNERNGAQNSALQKDEGFYAWIGTIRYAAITVAGTALILVLIISIVKKKHQKKKKNQDNNKTENPNPPK
jgi:hypothetical protein